MQKPQARPLSPAEAAAEMLKKRQQLVEQTSRPVGFTQRNAPSQEQASSQQAQSASPLLGAVGSVGSTVAGNALANSIFPSSSPGAAQSSAAVPSWTVSTGNAYPSSGYPLTESMMTESGAGSQMTPMTSSIATTSDGAPAAYGSGAFASYGIPAAVAGSTAIGVNSALNAYDKGKDSGAQESFKSSNNDWKDAGKVVATGGLSLYGDAAGALLGDFQSGKDKDQKRRDVIRGNMQDAGLIGGDYLLNGVDIGKDGHFTKDNGLHPYEVDLNDPESSQMIADLNPLGAIYARGNDKGTSDAVGLLSYGLGNDKDKIREAYSSVGGYKGAYDTINKMVDQKMLSRETADAYLNGLDSLFGANAYASGGKSSGGGKGKKHSKGSGKEETPTTVDWNKPTPTTPAPSDSRPYSQNDYIQAIVDTYDSNASDEVKKKKKKENPLSRRYV